MNLTEAEKAAILYEKQLQDIATAKQAKIRNFHQKEKQRVKFYRIVEKEAEEQRQLKILTSARAINKSCQYFAKGPAQTDDDLTIEIHSEGAPQNKLDIQSCQEPQSNLSSEPLRTPGSVSCSTSDTGDVNIHTLMKVARCLNVPVYPRLALGLSATNNASLDARGSTAGTSRDSVQLDCRSESQVPDPASYGLSVAFSGIPDRSSGRQQGQLWAQQRATCRKVYSAIERHATNRDRQRQEIERLKAEREKKRLEEEAKHRVPSVEVASECREDKPGSASEVEDSSTKTGADDKGVVSIDKEVETIRYVAAMLFQLKEQCDQLHLDIPPLCPCWSSVWQTRPHECCNNCHFYKNPTGFLTTLVNFVRSMQNC